MVGGLCSRIPKPYDNCSQELQHRAAWPVFSPCRKLGPGGDGIPLPHEPPPPRFLAWVLGGGQARSMQAPSSHSPVLGMAKSGASPRCSSWLQLLGRWAEGWRDRVPPLQKPGPVPPRPEPASGGWRRGSIPLPLPTPATAASWQGLELGLGRGVFPAASWEAYRSTHSLLASASAGHLCAPLLCPPPCPQD